jgi:hypothetical protein
MNIYCVKGVAAHAGMLVCDNKWRKLFSTATYKYGVKMLYSIDLMRKCVCFESLKKIT